MFYFPHQVSQLPNYGMKQDEGFAIQSTDMQKYICDSQNRFKKNNTLKNLELETMMNVKHDYM